MIDCIAIFEKLRFHPEDEVVEFKKAENSFDFDDLGKYFSALSNEANLRDNGFAWLVFGVHDKTREILGTSYKNSVKSLQKLKHDIAQHITDNNTFRDIYELSVEGKRVLLFQVWRLAGKDNVGQVFSIPFLLTTTEVMYKIRNYPFKIFPNNRLIPSEGMKYDSESILEALHNCIAHQDYTQNARIIVIERENELEFRNSGRFYDGTYEDYISGDRIPNHYRNPFLAQAMANIKMIDTEGFGIHKMYISQKERFLPMPDYDKSDDENVVLTLPGNVIDENYSLLLIEKADIDLATTVLLDKVQKGKPISDAAIKILRKQRLIEGRKPHLYISKQIAKATNKEVEYTLKKGFDDTECQEWIIKALKDHTVLSRKQIDELLWGKLPIDYTDEQKLSKIKNLLQKLHKNGVVWLDKNRKWHLKES